MAANDFDYKKYMMLAKRNKRLWVIAALAIMTVVIIGSYLLPNKYEAKSTVFIEKSVIADLVRGLAVTPSIEEKIKASLPEVRSKILLLLATKKASELATPEGKTHLMDDIATISNAVLGIVNKHAQPASAVAAAKAASQVAEAGAEGGHGAPTEAAATHVPAPQAEEKKGIVDVLFTSFIIQ